MSNHSFNKKTCWCTILCMLITLTACSPSKEEKKEGDFSEEDIQALSETMGHFLVENLHTQHFKMDINSLIQGIENAEAGGAPPLSKQEFYQMMTKYKNNIMNVKSAENLKLADDFLAENKLEPGITSLEEGKVQYRVLTRGSGPTVDQNGKPLVNYEGKLIDGTVFDSTQMRGKPMPLPLRSTIPGFKLGVSGMKQGEKRRIYIHPEMGYGTRGRLPPNSLLIFDVEIVEAETEQDTQAPTDEDANGNSGEEQENEEGNANGDENETSYKWLKKIREAVF